MIFGLNWIMGDMSNLQIRENDEAMEIGLPGRFCCSGTGKVENGVNFHVALIGEMKSSIYLEIRKARKYSRSMSRVTCAVCALVQL
jgi:hypothetical protein